MRPPCTVEGCDTPIHAKGLCCMHYRRNRLHGDPSRVWVMREKRCQVEDCDRAVRSDDYCTKHYQRWRKTGDPHYLRVPVKDGPVPHGTRMGYGYHGCRCEECARYNSFEGRGYRLKQYGLTQADFDRMLESQDHGCAICGDGPAPGQRLHVDHCHATGKVRGLLCSPCNRALGFMKDDAERLVAGAAYLLEHAGVDLEANA